MAEPNLNSKQGAGKPHKQRTFRLLVCGVIPVWGYEANISEGILELSVNNFNIIGKR